MRHILIFSIAALISLSACRNTNDDFEGSGVFEATEVVVSAEASGQLLEFDLDEGTTLTADQVVGHVDCEDLSLQKAQVAASKEALVLKKVEAIPEVNVLKKQIATQQEDIKTLQTQYAVLVRERDRVKALVEVESAPSKQLDDAQGQVDILEQKIATAQAHEATLEQQIKSARLTASMRNRSILSEDDPLDAQIKRIDHQIDNCAVINPIAGTVIAKYVEQYEMVNNGKALYKIANLDHMTLRAYLSGDQLTGLKLGQQVKVLVDNSNHDYRTYDGVISWISDKAEFTPKTIQTKKERANLVYAVKVDVQNDGYLRIGMYGELDY